MPDEIYEIISLAARYWFALLGLLIVWRSFSWLRKDRRAKHRRLRQLPDAGMIGELVVLHGSDELPEGTAIPVPREGVLGFIRTCDVVVPVQGVARQHIDFTFQDGRGLLLFPLRGCDCVMDETPLDHRSKTKKYPMHHGSRLTVGEAVLRLRLFAGLETERHPVLYDDAPQPFPGEQPPTEWQQSPYIYHQVPASWQDATGQYSPVTDDWQAQAPWPEDDIQPAPWLEGPDAEQSWLPPGPFCPPQEQTGFDAPQPWQRHPRSGRRHEDEA